MTTPSSLLSMRSVEGEYYLRLQEARDAAFYRRIASTFTTNQPSEDYPWLGDVPVVIPWEGDRSAQELRGHKVTLVTSEYELTMKWKRPDFRRDKTQQIQARIADGATAIAQHPDFLMSQLLIANGLAYDGVAMFSGSHVVAESGTIDNDVVAADGLAGGAAPTTAEMAANIMLVIERIMGFKTDRGRAMNTNRRQFAVMIPVNMWKATLGALAVPFTSAGVTNQLMTVSVAGGLNIVPILNGNLTATNQFYVFVMDAGIKAMLYQSEFDRRPESLDENSEHAKKTNEVWFGDSCACAAGYGRFELAARGTTS